MSTSLSNHIMSNDNTTQNNDTSSTTTATAIDYTSMDLSQAITALQERDVVVNKLSAHVNDVTAIAQTAITERDTALDELSNAPTTTTDTTALDATIADLKTKLSTSATQATASQATIADMDSTITALKAKVTMSNTPASAYKISDDILDAHANAEIRDMAPGVSKILKQLAVTADAIIPLPILPIAIVVKGAGTVLNAMDLLDSGIASLKERLEASNKKSAAKSLIRQEVLQAELTKKMDKLIAKAPDADTKARLEVTKAIVNKATTPVVFSNIKEDVPTSPASSVTGNIDDSTFA